MTYKSFEKDIFVTKMLVIISKSNEINCFIKINICLTRKSTPTCIFHAFFDANKKKSSNIKAEENLEP